MDWSISWLFARRQRFFPGIFPVFSLVIAGRNNKSIKISHFQFTLSTSDFEWLTLSMQKRFILLQLYKSKYQHNSASFHSASWTNVAFCVISPQVDFWGCLNSFDLVKQHSKRDREATRVQTSIVQVKLASAWELATTTGSESLNTHQFKWKFEQI